MLEESIGVLRARIALVRRLRRLEVLSVRASQAEISRELLLDLIRLPRH